MGIENSIQPKSVISLPVVVSQQKQTDEVQKPDDKPKILKNNLKNNAMCTYQRVTSAFTEYPAKGLKGDRKSTFYEFLTMGIVPTLIGSLTFMGLFNTNKGFSNFDRKGAKSFGGKMALGVIFFGLAKSLSKHFISKPVKMATGIDTEMPYQNITYSIPASKNDTPMPQYEHHKVFESKDFPRFDLLYGVDPEDPDRKDVPRNYYYDRIAEKNGLGKNLEASDSEVKPLLKDVISRSNTAKSLSSYAWGATGVMLATQPSWDNFLNAISKKSWIGHASDPAKNMFVNGMDKAANVGKNLLRITKSFGRNFVKASKEFYKGPEFEKGFAKHAGKAFLGLAIGLSLFGAINTIYGAKKYGNRKLVIDNNKKVLVD